MKEIVHFTILDVPIVKVIKRIDKENDNTYHSNRIILFGAGYASQKEAEHVHFNIGITKFEMLWSFCIRKRWLL